MQNELYGPLTECHTLENWLLDTSLGVIYMKIGSMDTSLSDANLTMSSMDTSLGAKIQKMSSMDTSLDVANRVS